MKSQEAFDLTKEKNSEESILKQRIENSVRLHEAIDNNDIIKIEEILAEGNVDVHYEYSGILDINISPLCKLNMLCRKVETISEDDALKIMQILINYGADVNKEWSGMSPLFCAIGMEPKPLLIKCLLDAGADVNIGSSSALRISYDVITELLLANGADIYKIDGLLEISSFNRAKTQLEKMENDADHEISDLNKINCDLYLKAAFIDDLFNKADKDMIQQSLDIALKLVNDFSDHHIDFMLTRFKNLRANAIKEQKVTDNIADFIDYLKQIINYDFLPEKLKIGFASIVEDYLNIDGDDEISNLSKNIAIYTEEKIKQLKALIDKTEDFEDSIELHEAIVEDDDITQIEDKENFVKLYTAIDKNDIEEIKKILAEGNVDVHYEYVQTPIHQVAYKCMAGRISESDALEIMHLLVEYGFEVNKLDFNATPLFICSVNSSNLKPKLLLIDYLLKVGADVNLIRIGGSSTPLHAVRNDIEGVKKLLAYGADIHLQNYGRTPLDIIKESMENEIFLTTDKYPGFDAREIVHDFYMKAAFIDDLFNKANKDIIQQSLNIALKLIGQLSDDHIDFMLCRFKSLCAMKNAKLTGEESSDFAEHLKQTMNYDFLPEKLKIGLQDILEDYEEVIDNIKSFALWDAYKIYVDEESLKHANESEHANENEIQPITAPINFKQVQAILINDNPKDLEIFQHISGFCEQRPIYKGHSYLKDESSKNEITRITLEHLDCASKVKEFFTKYKGIFYSEVIGQAIDDYEHTQSLAGNTNLSLSEEIPN